MNHLQRESDGTLRSLMAAYQAGDPAAFETLYAQLSPQLLAYLTYLCRDVHLAEDLVQDSFLQIHRARHTYLPSRPVRPWAFGVARHVFQMNRRSAERRSRHEKKFPSIDWRLPEEIERIASADAVEHVLMDLPEDRRESVILHHGLGLSFKEIGALLGVQAGTAKLRVFRALKQLKSLVAQKELARDGDV